MNTMVFKVKIRANLKLREDEYLEGMMAGFLESYPQIKGFVWERIDEDHIQILMWGEDDDGHN